MRVSAYGRIERDRLEAGRAARELERRECELDWIRRELATIGVSLALLKLERALARKYRPDQPRVPAGEPGGGQWIGDNDGWSPGAVGSLTERVREAARRGRRLTEEECREQYERDIFQCKMVGLPSCYAQAAERYAACLVGRPIPPLNY